MRFQLKRLDPRRWSSRQRLGAAVGLAVAFGAYFVTRAATSEGAGPGNTARPPAPPLLRAALQGGRILTPPILFAYDSATLDASARPILASVVQIMAGISNRVRIEGHTDSAGPATYNQSLSERRANAVKSALMGLGIPGNRMDAVGFGESQLLPGATDAQNRRVEFVLI